MVCGPTRSPTEVAVLRPHPQINGEMINYLFDGHGHTVATLVKSGSPYGLTIDGYSDVWGSF